MTFASEMANNVICSALFTYSDSRTGPSDLFLRDGLFGNGHDSKTGAQKVNTTVDTSKLPCTTLIGRGTLYLASNLVSEC